MNSRPTFRIFLVRPWHSSGSSASPYLNDGVEHVQTVVTALRDAVSIYNRNPASAYRVELNHDETVFRPGRHLLAQLNREMQRIDLALVVLDGLRPNVVFEYGLMLGHLQGLGTDQSDNIWERVIGLRATDATVLVRNFYPDKLHAPTLYGQPAVVVNPPLDIQSHFSDIAGLFLHYYDRHNIFASIRDWFIKFLDTEIPNYEPLRSEASASVDLDDEAEIGGTARNAEIWRLYRNQQYEEIVEKAAALKEPDELQALALSYMRINQTRDAVRTWQQLSRLGAHEFNYTVDVHLGICHYILRDFASARFHLTRALERESPPGKAELWLRRLEGRVDGTVSTRAIMSGQGVQIDSDEAVVDVAVTASHRPSAYQDFVFSAPRSTPPSIDLVFVEFVGVSDDEVAPDDLWYEPQRVTERSFRVYLKRTSLNAQLPMGTYRFALSTNDDGADAPSAQDEAETDSSDLGADLT